MNKLCKIIIKNNKDTIIQVDNKDNCKYNIVSKNNSNISNDIKLSEVVGSKILNTFNHTDILVKKN